MCNIKLLSICIPTNGAIQFVLPALESIYSQGVDESLFEVVITDNGKDSNLREVLTQRNYPNLQYHKTNDIGFMNQISCFKLAKGKLIRMINHRSILLSGVLQKWIDLAKKYEKERPIIYFSGGNIKNNQTEIRCSNFESFLSQLSYWSSWSAGISFWDTDKPLLDFIEFNPMFPTTSILFEIRQQSKYIIWNEQYQQMQDETGKGGYNIYKTFAVDYLDMLNELRLKNRISIKTFTQIKSELLLFLQQWYDILSSKKNKYTFETSNMEMYLGVYYTETNVNKIKNNKIRILSKTLRSYKKKICRLIRKKG